MQKAADIPIVLYLEKRVSTGLKKTVSLSRYMLNCIYTVIPTPIAFPTHQKPR